MLFSQKYCEQQGGGYGQWVPINAKFYTKKFASAIKINFINMKMSGSKIKE